VRVVALKAGVRTPEEHRNNQDEQAGLPQIKFDVPQYLHDVKHLHTMHCSKTTASLNCKPPKHASRAQSSCIVTFIHERKAKKGYNFLKKQNVTAARAQGYALQDLNCFRRLYHHQQTFSRCRY
jgi:hypothetical protein